jgi:uncharacterized protein (DUF433 family)
MRAAFMRMPEQHSALREPWRARLNIPVYQVQEAARYAGMSPQTIRHWQAGEDLIRSALSARDPRAALSYMQLIEVAVVAAFRKAGIPLRDIRAAREYIKNAIKSEYPFAQYSFKTRGRSILVDYVQIDKRHGKGKLLDVTKGGQLAWESIIAERLKEFEYDRELALRWHVAGVGEPIIIDPRVSFGAPAVSGVPTWVLKARWESGEAIDDIASDFDLSNEFVLDALKFEGIDTGGRQTVWTH